MPQNLFAQFVCPSPKVLAFNEKRLHWASLVSESTYSFKVLSCKITVWHGRAMVSRNATESLTDIWRQSSKIHLNRGFYEQARFDPCLKLWTANGCNTGWSNIHITPSGHWKFAA
jgi:hypothetical protein